VGQPAWPAKLSETIRILELPFHLRMPARQQREVLFFKQALVKHMLAHWHL
jgi:hypothetical protein